MNITANFNTQ